MRVMVFHKTSEDMKMDAPTPEQLEAFAAMDRFTEELVKAGVFIAAAGLKGGAEARRIVFPGRTVIDGPFAESRELVVGFSIWEVKDMDEAVEWAKRCPNPTGEESELEIRVIQEMEDFGPAFTDEAREQEDRLRAQLEQQQKA